jgi:uroporphyrinogen decarboxylase
MSTHVATFSGLRVAAFESRRAEEMSRLIEKLGGRASVSPSLRDNPEAVDFAHRLMSGQVDVVLLMTGVGTRHFLAQVERSIPRERFLAALSDVTTIARGPKPIAVLKELGLTPTLRVPEPNTWREVLRTIDQHLAVAHQTVLVQEYGLPNPSLVAGLEARGATVLCLKVYDWDLPLDRGPLVENVEALARGEIDVALFTSAHQVTNLLRVAEEREQLAPLLHGLARAVVASIGPTTSEALRAREIAVDLEPEHNKMGQLVLLAAERGPELARRKQSVFSAAPREIVAAPQVALDRTAAWYDSPFLRACRREPTEFTPVWLMRQAGRYMAEYREVRARTTFLDLCKNSALCAEVMITAVRRLGVDAAIIFSDLLPMLEPMGVELEFAQGEGPVIHNPVRESEDVDRIVELESLEALEFVMETVRQTRAGLPAATPLIGFAGAPFTLASYTIEGGSSRSFLFTKTLMFRDEGAWHALMARLARSIARYLNAQIAAGAQAVQVFDSWVGCLGPDDYRRYVLPHNRSLFASLPADVPVIHFGAGNPALLPLVVEAGGSVIGVDWRVRLDDAWRAVGYDRAVQGNLDPSALLATPAEIRLRAQEVLRQAEGRPGHIFNLGHGVLQQTPVEHAIALVEAVHDLSRR